MRRIAVGAIVGMVAVAVGLSVAASSDGKGHSQLPVGYAQRASSKLLRLGFGKVLPWQWSMWAEDRSDKSAEGPVCFSVGLIGPLVTLPGGRAMGPESSDKKCGPIKPNRGAVLTIPMEAGTQTPPSGEAESWPAFDVGVAAYPPEIDQVRLVFSDGGSEVLKARAVPAPLAFKHAEAFKYVVFAVEGCVRDVQGLSKGRVVARAGNQECGDSPE